MRKLWKAVCVAVLVLLLTALWGCQKAEFQLSEDNGTSCGNIIMGMGELAFKDDFLYFADTELLFEYDLQSGKTTFLPAATTFPMNLHVTENHLVYSGFWDDPTVYAVTKDGKDTQTLFETGRDLYIKGDNAYYITEDRRLFRRSMSEETETLLVEDCYEYFWTESGIYAIREQDEEKALWKSDPDGTAFEQIPLSFAPIALLATEDDVFLSKRGKPYHVVRYHRGEEIPLPIRSLKYQVLDGHLIFADEETFENSTWTYKSYDLETGEITVLCESAMEFGVFADRYIAFWCRGEIGSWWMLYDWQTKELKQIYPEAA